MKEVDTKDNVGWGVMDSKHKLKQNEAQNSVIRRFSAMTSIHQVKVNTLSKLHRELNLSESNLKSPVY